MLSSGWDSELGNTCFQCDEVFTNGGDLGDHIKTIHSLYSIYQGDICGISDIEDDSSLAQDDIPQLDELEQELADFNLHSHDNNT